MNQIVEAVGAASGSVRGEEGRQLSGLVQAAMSQAAMDCLAGGITDPDVTREWMLEARARVKAEQAGAAVVAAADAKHPLNNPRPEA